MVYNFFFDFRYWMYWGFVVLVDCKEYVIEKLKIYYGWWWWFLFVINDLIFV